MSNIFDGYLPIKVHVYRAMAFWRSETNKLSNIGRIWLKQYFGEKDVTYEKTGWVWKCIPMSPMFFSLCARFRRMAALYMDDTLYQEFLSHLFLQNRIAYIWTNTAMGDLMAKPENWHVYTRSYFFRQNFIKSCKRPSTLNVSMCDFFSVFQSPKQWYS